MMHQNHCPKFSGAVHLTLSCLKVRLKKDHPKLYDRVIWIENRGVAEDCYLKC